jgi:PST family polysaccharide transporter
MSYTKEIIKGLSWMGALKAITRLITFGRVAILARLLSPIQFGVFGVATMGLAFLETLTDTGINVFFVQKEGKLEDYLDTAWMVSIARGTLIGLLLVSTSFYVANFFHSPEAQIALSLIGLCAFVRGFINPAIISFQQKLQFNKEFWLRFSIFVVDTVVSVTLAFITKSAISMVWGLIAGCILEVIASFVFIKPRPRLIWNKLKVKNILKRGKWVTLAGIFQYLFANGDNIVVGRLMDTAALGYYQMAYRISIIPITEITDVFSKVTFPVYSNFGSEKKRLWRAFSKTAGVIALLVIPISILIFAFPTFIVNVLLGKDWLTIVPALKVLAVFGVVRSLSAVFLLFFYQLKNKNMLPI